MFQLKRGRKPQLLTRSALAISLACGAFTGSAMAEEIVHDAEYYILEAQHGKKWAADNKKQDGLYSSS